MELAGRDYSDLANDIPMIGGITTEDRKKDVKEERVREMLFGDGNKVYAEASYDFYNYLYAVN